MLLFAALSDSGIRFSWPIDCSAVVPHRARPLAAACALCFGDSSQKNERAAAACSPARAVERCLCSCLSNLELLVLSLTRQSRVLPERPPIYEEGPSGVLLDCPGRKAAGCAARTSGTCQSGAGYPKRHVRLRSPVVPVVFSPDAYVTVPGRQPVSRLMLQRFLAPMHFYIAPSGPYCPWEHSARVPAALPRSGFF